MRNRQFAIEALPSVRGQLYSLVHLPTGGELLAPGRNMQVGGYTDRLPGATSTIGWDELEYHRHWLGDTFPQDVPGRITLFGLPITSPWSTPRGLRSRRQRYQLRRDVILSPQGDAVRIERRYLGQRIRRDEQVFEARWSLAVPEPSQAQLILRENEAERRFALGTLRADAGAAGADDRPLSLTDVMQQEFDLVEGRALKLQSEAEEGNLVIVLDRGDGLAVELTTPAAGNRSVALTPVLAENRFTVAIGSRPHPLPADDNDTEVTLPPQTLRVLQSEVPTREHKTRTRRNPKDGAEMVWVPAGLFLMGTSGGEGNPDEGPQRRIELDGYWIYRRPVTVAQYRRFCEETGRAMPSLPKGSDGDSHPIFDVNWHEAAA